MPRALELHHTPATSRLFPRVDVEQHRNDDQYQRLHEDEEAERERAVFVVGIRVTHKRPHYQAAHQPDKLSFRVPHREDRVFDFKSTNSNPESPYLITPVSQRMMFSAN